EALTQGNLEIACLWRKIADQNQLLAKYYENAAEAHSSGNLLESIRFDHSAAESAQSSIECLDLASSTLDKAIESEKRGDQALAAVYQKTADQNQLLAEYKRKTAEAHASGNIAEATRFKKVEDSTTSSVDRLNLASSALDKAIEADKRGDQLLVTLYRKIADQNQLAVEYKQKVEEAQVSENASEASFFNKADVSISSSADRLNAASIALEKAVELEKNGNKESASFYRKMAEQNQFIAEYYRRISELQASGNVLEGRLFDSFTVTAARSSLDCLNLTVTALDKAIEAERNNKHEVVALWRKIADQNQLAVEYKRKVMEVPKVENVIFEQARFGKAGDSMMGSIDCLKLAIVDLEKSREAEKKGNRLLCLLYRNIADQNQLAAKYKQQVAQSQVDKDELESNRFNSAYISTKSAVDCLNLASIALEKSFEIGTSGHQPSVRLYQEIAEQNQLAASYQQKVAQATVSKNELDSSRFDEAYTSTKSAVDRLNLASTALEKSLEAEKRGNHPLATLYQKITKQNQLAASYQQKVAKAKISRTLLNETLSNKADVSIGSSIDCLNLAATALAQAFEFEKSNNQPIAALYRKTAEQNQLLAEHYKKAAEAQVSGNEFEAARFTRANISMNTIINRLNLASIALEKVLEVQGGDPSLIALCQKIVEQNQQVVEYYQKGVENEVVGNVLEVLNNAGGNRVEITRFYNAGDSSISSADRLKSASNALEKALTAEQRGNKSLAAIYRKVSDKYQLAAQSYQEGAKAHSNGTRVIEAARFDDAGDTATSDANELWKQAGEPANK
ncbi:MAG TPA: hypothetical protein VJK54_07015, partial [Chthoniobacterales bacterium]|nr:hypothetical protein [Chthoniobacterales bacterium]